MPRGKDHHYRLQLTWTGAEDGPAEDYKTFSRAHRAEFEGKASLAMTADTAFMGDPEIHNPEEMLLLALSSCHMLSYLALAALQGVTVVAYEDSASGIMHQEGYSGRFTEVVLRPKVVLASGNDLEVGEKLHGEANKTCFIANSVNFPVRHEAEITCLPG